MKVLAFDTLEFTKRLRAAHFTEKQAEALAQAMADMVESCLVTKEDSARLQQQIKEKKCSPTIQPG